MMNMFEEAVIYSTVMHTGAVRKDGGIPYILHPLEVAQIISTMTNDVEVLTAGVLHDVVEDTDGTLNEIRARFGDRVAMMVESETENKYPGQDAVLTWRKRKEESIIKLKNSTDLGVRMLWLADKLANIRSFVRMYREKGEVMWSAFHMSDSEQQHWYYKTIAEQLEIDLNRTAAFKEFIQHINFIWPCTFEADKTKYKKYREFSVDGCPVIGRGEKGTVYRYDDELVIKVYNKNNTYKEIERENYLARKAFVSGIPTAISFGIVKVGDRYGSMFELLDSKSVSQLIAQKPASVNLYADMMADLALKIHAVDGSELELNDYTEEVYRWIHEGIEYVDAEMSRRVTALVDALPRPGTLIHGDFHTGNVMLQDGELLIIDMDTLSVCHPIVELSAVYRSFVVFCDMDPVATAEFKGFNCEVQRTFFQEFIQHYLKTEDHARIQKVTDQAALLAYVRQVRRIYKKGFVLDEKQTAERDYYLQKIRDLLDRVDSLDF